LVKIYKRPTKYSIDIDIVLKLSEVFYFIFLKSKKDENIFFNINTLFEFEGYVSESDLIHFWEESQSYVSCS